MINNKEAIIDHALIRLHLINDSNDSKAHNSRHYNYILELIDNIISDANAIHVNEEILDKLKQINTLMQNSKAYNDNKLRNKHLQCINELISNNVR